MIHRDIKPENILVADSKTWHIKLCDFGWASHAINENRMTYCGTPDYLAPEMVKKVPYDYKIDNWTIGILTYELLTGASPFCPSMTSGKTQQDIYDNILNAELMPNEIYEREVSPLAKDFIMTILQNDP